MASGTLVENGESVTSTSLSSSATSVTSSSTSSGSDSNINSITTTTTNANANAPLSPASPSTPTFPSAATPLIATPAPRLPVGSMRTSRRFHNAVSIASTSASSVTRPWMHSGSGLPSPSRCSSQFFEDGPSPYDLADLEAPRPPFARIGSVSDRSSVISSRFSLLPDPSTWGSATHTNVPEPDDDLHTPDPNRDETVDKGGTVFTSRGVLNLGCMIVIIAGLFALFAGAPLVFHFTHTPAVKIGNSARVNSTGQVPIRAARRFILKELER